MGGGELPTGAVAPASSGLNSGELGWGMGMALGLGALGRGGDPIPRLSSRRGRSEGGARREAEGGGNGDGRRPAVYTRLRLGLLELDYQKWEERVGR
jgi:hypothetical protein